MSISWRLIRLQYNIPLYFEVKVIKVGSFSHEHDNLTQSD